ncbi:ABC transporter ATP-binding protein [Methyloligella sp. 2.7D]|uniref:ABC transporter ATP-binding protein n=1 Tax=unclassified Methyloligella TaxID=2625955 RepID=UPI00157DE26A|nr:ABC transporter ATP-binding protein [Methyloligella sp. GL2]QKP76007.1 ABC transporter ATP-binding protein [Methyloligella sp. GL2]
MSGPTSSGQARKPILRLTGVTKKYGRKIAVKPTDLTIQRGEFFAILGPSGCGKSTLLRMIGGFVKPSGGTIEIDGADVTALSPERRPSNMVFQSYGLFVHMTVRQNVAYGLRIAKVAKSEIDDRVAEVLKLVHLHDFADRDVTRLSGGERQRVALARALVMRPKVLLLDEPLAALDLKLRKAMHAELRDIHHAIGGTFVLVSHDQGEVMSLADRVAVMESGSIVQEGSPRQIYREPATRFISTFIGDANVLSAERKGGVVKLEAGIEFPDEGPDTHVNVIVRPENILIDGDAPMDVSIEGELVDVIFFGSYVQLRFHLDDGTDLIAHTTDETAVCNIEVGHRVKLGWNYDQQRTLDT